MSEKKSNLRDTEFYNSKPLKIFFSYYKPHLKIFLLDMFCAVLISLIDICFPMISKFTIDSILPEQKFKTFFTAENPLGTCSHCFYFHSACNYNYDDFAFKTKRNFKKGKGNYGGD